jgi:hypothetical protein
MDNLLCSGAEKKDPVHEEATHMKRTTSPWPYLPLAAFILSLYAGAVQARVDLHYGTPVDMGNGTIRTYIAFNAADAPIEIGILMSGCTDRNRHSHERRLVRRVAQRTEHHGALLRSQRKRVYRREAE